MASVFLENFNPQTATTELINRFQQGMQTAGKPYQPSTHDDVHILAEAVAYLLMLQHSQIEHGLSQSFLSFATGTALDHLGQTFYGVNRLAGVKPTAQAVFKLSQKLDYKVVIRKNSFVSGTANGDQAFLLDDLVFEVDPNTKKTAQSKPATLVLQRAVARSSEKASQILTPLPFLATVVQGGDFENGQTAETDTEYKRRLVQSLFKQSTAGSFEAYQFFAKSAANRIEKIDAYSTAAGKVTLRYFAPVMDDAMQKRLEDALNNSKTRPIGEQLTIQKASIKTIDFTANVAFEGLVNLQRIEQVIRQKFAEYANFNRTIYKTAFSLWVEDDSNLINFEVTSPATDVTLKRGEFPVLGAVRLVERTQPKGQSEAQE